MTFVCFSRIVLQSIKTSAFVFWSAKFFSLPESPRPIKRLSAVWSQVFYTFSFYAPSPGCSSKVRSYWIQSFLFFSFLYQSLIITVHCSHRFPIVCNVDRSFWSWEIASTLVLSAGIWSSSLNCGHLLVDWSLQLWHRQILLAQRW